MVYFVLDDYCIEAVQLFSYFFSLDILVFDLYPLKPFHLSKHSRYG